MQNDANNNKKVRKDNDRFSDPEYVNVKDNPAMKRTRKHFPFWLLMRYQPRLLTNTIRVLSDAQKDWVRSIGFESILSFSMNEHPQALGYSLVLGFQRDICSLVFGKNVKIPISPEDVNEVLGLPLGPRRIQILRDRKLETKWRSQYPDVVDPWKVT